MNERLENLFEQAFEYARTESSVRSNRAIVEKFAELIVRECAKEAFNFWSNQVDSNEESAQWHIKQHFGVE